MVALAPNKMEWYVTIRVDDAFILFNNFPRNIECGVYYQKFFDEMYFKCLVIFPLPSKKVRNL